MKPAREITEQRLIKALAHPLRVRIMGLLEQGTASPSEIAEQIGAPLGNVSYHVRQLHAFGLIELVSETPRRGAVEHHYRATARPRITDGAWAETPAIVKGAMASAAVGQIAARVNEAVDAGGFDRAEMHLSRTELSLDDRGWRALAKELEALLKRAERIQAESEKRAADAGHPPETHSTLVVMHFESLPEAVEKVGRRRGRARAGAGARARA